MKRLLPLLLLLLLLARAAHSQGQVLITAYFNTSTTAVISWEQPAGVHQTCLRRVYGATWPAGICWHDLPAGPFSAELPGDLEHPAYRPAHGDRYILEFDGIDVGSALLGEAVVYETYLALTMKQTAQRAPPVYLAWVGR